MLGWSFELDTLGAWGRLLRAMQGHRYLAEVDHRLHWSVDLVMSRFGGDATAWPSDLDRASRDPRAWRPASVDDIAHVLATFWGPDRVAATRALRGLLTAAEVTPSTHSPGDTDPDEPPHPELILLDWAWLPVDELDTERHRGALRALERAEEEVDPSEPLFVEGPTFAFSELTEGPWNEPIFWAGEPHAYADYLFRGVAKAAKLPPPLGFHDFG